MPDKLVEWSTAVQVREGEIMSGDHYLICRAGGERVLVAVVDGIGHGPEAAEASQLAACLAVCALP
jgi:negative regulator of sigma-B (phosphoserine phosphatase)